MQRACLAAVALLLASSCKKTEAPSSTQSPAQAAAQPVAQEVPLTTKVPQAADLFRQARAAADNSKLPEARELLGKALALDPDFARAHAELAIQTTGDEQKKHAERAAALVAGLPEAEGLLVQIRLLVLKGDLAGHAAALQKLGTLAANDPHVQILIGQRANAENQIDAALAAFQRAAQLDPKMGQAHNLLGYVFIQQKKWDAAISEFRKYAELEPNEPNAHDSLAEALLSSGKVTEADAEYVKAAQGGMAQSWEGAAIARFYNADWKGAHEALAKAHEAIRDPRQRLFSDLTAAEGLALEGKNAEALTALAKVGKEAEAQKLAPVQMNALLTAAAICIEMGEPKAARPYLAAAQVVIDSGALIEGARIGWTLGTLRMRLWADVRAGDLADAQKILPEMEKVAATRSNIAFVKSTLHFAHGLLALAEKEPKHAAEEMAKCEEGDPICQAERFAALEKAGDKAGADAVKAAILARFDRNTLSVAVRKRLGGLPAGATASK
jgi:tetratricopeptide (TPR) repeat protein